MGSSGGSAPPPAPPPLPPERSSADMMEEMMPFYQMMMQQNQQYMAQMAQMQPPPPALPEIEVPEPIDFEQEEKLLEARAKGQAAVDAARKYGRTDTLHAPLLLDEADTTDEEASGLLIDQ